MRKQITVFGDIMWNYEPKTFSALPVECSPRILGGTLITVSRKARKYFDTVIAVGAVGLRDKIEVDSVLASFGIDARIQGVDSVGTGCCVLTFQEGVRTGITSVRQANMYLDLPTIAEVDTLDSSYVFANGWSFLPESKTSHSLLRTLGRAAERGARVIFDVLPHHIQFGEMTGHYLRALSLARIVVFESHPQLGSENIRFDPEVIRKNCRDLELLISFDWTKSFRVETPDGAILSEGPTHYTHQAEPGYLDGLALREILRHFGDA